MTEKQMISTLKGLTFGTVVGSKGVEALEMAIKALSQEPCELLIIKSDILLHQDDRKKLAETIKREKESGVIILQPYFEPLLVPNDIEINIEQEPCEDAISREDAIQAVNNTLAEYIPYFRNDQIGIPLKCARALNDLSSVTQKSAESEDKE